jgi:Bacterial antitoxin of type II TA system, VapB
MPTNLAIDDGLIREAQEIGNHSSKKAAVTAALREYISHRKQLKIIDLFGTVDYDPAYNYRQARALDRIEVDGQ